MGLEVRSQPEADVGPRRAPQGFRAGGSDDLRRFIVVPVAVALDERSSIVSVGRKILPPTRIPVLDPDAIDAPLAVGFRKTATK